MCITVISARHVSTCLRWMWVGIRTPPSAMLDPHSGYKDCPWASLVTLWASLKNILWRTKWNNRMQRGWKNMQKACCCCWPEASCLPPSLRVVLVSTVFEHKHIEKQPELLSTDGLLLQFLQTSVKKKLLKPLFRAAFRSMWFSDKSVPRFFTVLGCIDPTIHS